MHEPPSRRAPLVLVLGASLAFASAAPLGKVAQAIPAPLVAGTRTLVASLILAAVSARELGAITRGLSRVARLRLLVAGIVFALHLTLFLDGLGRTSLAAAVALVSLQPIAVVAVAFLAFGARPTARELVAVAIATAGALVVGSGAGEGEHSIVGDAMVLGAVVLYGVYVAVARALKDALPAVPAAALLYACTCVVSLLVLAPLWPAPVATGEIGARAWGAVLLMGFLPTTLGHTLVQVAARRARPSVVALVSPGETIGALALGAALLGTLPSAREGAGALLVVLGATLAITAMKRGPAVE